MSAIVPDGTLSIMKAVTNIRSAVLDRLLVTGAHKRHLGKYQILRKIQKTRRKSKINQQEAQAVLLSHQVLMFRAFFKSKVHFFL